MPLIRSKPQTTDRQTGLAPGLDGLADSSAEVRWTAARAVAGQPGSVPALEAALARETDARVREAIFTALVRIASPESVLAVLPYVRSDMASLRTGALDALRAMPDRTQPHLQELLSDPDSDVRLLACDLARTMSGAEASRVLCALIEVEPHANVCAAAVEVLAEIGDADAVSSLGSCAARFPDDPFLAFAIRAAFERLGAQPDSV